MLIRKSVLSILFAMYAGAVFAQSSIDLSEIGAQAAQDCAENEECLVEQTLSSVTASSDLSAYENSGLSATAGEFAIAAAALAGGATLFGGSDAQSAENDIDPSGSEENGSFNVKKDKTDLQRMDEELLLLSLNQDVVQNTVTQCNGSGMGEGAIVPGDGDEFCSCDNGRCYECNYGEGGRNPIPCIKFSYSEGERPIIDESGSLDDIRGRIDRGHFQ